MKMCIYVPLVQNSGHFVPSANAIQVDDLATHFNHVLIWFMCDKLLSFLTNTLEFYMCRPIPDNL